MSETSGASSPDYDYTDPKTGVLRNLGGIADRDALTFAETAVATKRSCELKAQPIRVKDAGALFAVHRHLFQDLYEWAGKRRTVEISKGDKQFFPVSHFGNALKYIDGLIADYLRIDKADKAKLAKKLAEILDNVNFLHPFREGNGRAQREFLKLLAREKGWSLKLNPPDDAEIYERYMSGTIRGDVQALAALIFECLSK
ncbi:MAG: Fic family protein [Deltaproteobacteria bacterium]|jgi:cell filamentation protein|nr:Fic family protein [Deltaproteobacteria bacterium]